LLLLNYFTLSFHANIYVEYSGNITSLVDKVTKIA